jgi:hypothetical protein
MGGGGAGRAGTSYLASRHWSCYQIGIHVVKHFLGRVPSTCLSDKRYAYCEAAHLAFCGILKVDREACTNLVRNRNALRPERPRDIVRFAVTVALDTKNDPPGKFRKLQARALPNSKNNKTDILG